MAMTARFDNDDAEPGLKVTKMVALNGTLGTLSALEMTALPAQLGRTRKESL